MNPSQGQFDNVVNLDQKRLEKNQASMRDKSPYGPIKSGLVKPVTEAPEEDRWLANPNKESQSESNHSNV